MAELELVRNADDTITVRVGRNVEHVSIDGKSKGQVFDSIRWAAVAAGASVSEPELTEMLYRLRDAGQR